MLCKVKERYAGMSLDQLEVEKEALAQVLECMEIGRLYPSVAQDKLLLIDSEIKRRRSPPKTTEEEIQESLKAYESVLRDQANHGYFRYSLLERYALASNKIREYEDLLQKQAETICRMWNDRYPIGTRVAVEMDDGRRTYTTTMSTASTLDGYTPLIWLDGIIGAYPLERVVAV